MGSVYRKWATGNRQQATGNRARGIKMIGAIRRIGIDS